MSRMLSFATVVAVWVFALSTFQQAIAQKYSHENPARKRKRPEPKPLRIQKVSPEFDQFLTDWYNATKKVKTIEGITHKFEIDKVFNIESRGKGTFYYGAPDKGRLDIDPVIVKKGTKAKKGFSLKGLKAVKWLSTGRNILQIDVANKKGLRFKIPPESRGANIMHGPLPFLLGMPPDVIKRRYRLAVEQEDARQIRLKAIPNWPNDIANYKMARIILDKRTFLPSAVQLFDPTENLETVYTFSQIRVNKKRYFWQKDPIAGFPLKGIKIEDMIPNSGAQKRKVSKENSKTGRVRVSANDRKNRKATSMKKPKILPENRSIRLTVPNVIGLNFKEAEKRLFHAGFHVVYRRGNLARNASMVYHVQEQTPKPRAVSYQGKKIVLVLYVNPKQDRKKKHTASNPGRKKN